MTRQEFLTISELAAKVTDLQDLNPELIEVAAELWKLYLDNGGYEREIERKD